MQSYLSETLIEPTEFMRSMHILGLDQRGDARTTSAVALRQQGCKSEG